MRLSDLSTIIQRAGAAMVCATVGSMICGSASGQSHVILRDWKFKTGDSLQWASPRYSDVHWHDMKAGLWWAHAGYDYSGYAWYRKRIVIPSTLRAKVQQLGYLKLSLGQIQDVDQTFFNGKLIGHTGSFSPFQGKWGEPRVYFLTADQIHWDQPNLIAVRVYGPNQNGGMHTGPYSYEPYRITYRDYVKIVEVREVSQDEASQKAFTITFHNNSGTSYRGTLHFALTDTLGRVLQSRRLSVVVEKKGALQKSSTFLYTLPTAGIYHVGAVFTEKVSGAQLRKDRTISTLQTVTLPVASMPRAKIADKVRDLFVSAPFEDQQIGGILGSRMAINLERRLLQVDEQELLDGYLDRPGKQNWVGEHIGKYLETACNTWRFTHNADLKKQMDRMLFVLLHTQLPNGYLGTYTPENYWTNWDVWSHKYNLIGLLAYYRTTGYAPALEAARRIGDLLCRTFGTAPGQLDLMTSGTHVGMASGSVLNPMVDLYRYTGEPRYLHFAHYIIAAYNEADGPHIIETLLQKGKVNEVANAKAYEMLSNLHGIIKLYKVTGEKDLLKASVIAWEDIVAHRLYPTGTSSSFELFRGDDDLPAGADAHMGEGCVTVTWLQLNYELFTLTGDLKYLDQMERSTYNHLLAAENPQTGCVSYYTSLQNKKPYSCDLTCCLSSVPRGISMIPLFNYGKRKGVPTILLYESEQLKDTVITEQGQPVAFKLEGTSRFPDSGLVVYRIDPEQHAAFPLCFRVPRWVDHFRVIVDGTTYSGTQDEYITVTRDWHKGDQIVVQFDIPVRTISGGKSYPGCIAIERGPQVLSVDSSLNSMAAPYIPAAMLSGSLHLQPHGVNIPQQWVGRQVYSVAIPLSGGGTRTLSLVPFADASQTGAEAKVWIPVNGGK